MKSVVIKMTRLETITNVVLIAVSCAAGYILVHRQISEMHVAQRSTAPLGSTAPLVGRRLTIMAAAGLPARSSVVVAYSTHCHFCNESLAFYRDLIRKNKLNPPIQVVFASNEAADDVRDFLAKKGVEPDAIVHVRSLSSLGVDGTPTLLIADANGVVTREFAGKLSPQGETDVQFSLEKVRRSIPPP